MQHRFKILIIYYEIRELKSMIQFNRYGGLQSLITKLEAGLPSKMVNQPDSTADTVAEVVDDLNALLDKLKAAGVMEPDEE